MGNLLYNAPRHQAGGPAKVSRSFFIRQERLGERASFGWYKRQEVRTVFRKVVSQGCKPSRALEVPPWTRRCFDSRLS